MRVGLLPPALLMLLLPTLNALTLSDFQPINGFSAQCTQTYNTPLQGCTKSDFQSGHPCSTDCITFLEALTEMLNTNCKGTSAFPNTLIGLFFSQQGTSTLCPNVLGSSGSGGRDQASYPSAASPGGTSTRQASQSQASNAAVSTTLSSATTYFHPSPHASSSSSFSSSSASVTSSSRETHSSSATVPSSTFVTAETTVTPSNSPPSNTPNVAAPSSTSYYSSSISSTSRASSTGKGSMSGGGTILDIGSGAAAPATLQSGPQSWVLLGGLAVLAWLL